MLSYPLQRWDSALICQASFWHRILQSGARELKNTTTCFAFSKYSPAAVDDIHKGVLGKKCDNVWLLTIPSFLKARKFWQTPVLTVFFWLLLCWAWRLFTDPIQRLILTPELNLLGPSTIFTRIGRTRIPERYYTPKSRALVCIFEHLSQIISLTSKQFHSSISVHTRSITQGYKFSITIFAHTACRHVSVFSAQM